MRDRVDPSRVAPGAAVFRLATTPARWLSRFHIGLRSSLSDDAQTFGGGGARAVFVVLAVIAVAYAVAASVAHAFGLFIPSPQPDDYIRAPFFRDVYSESLVFMTVVAGIGAFSPALGVLFLAVFIPADLAAASYSGELIPSPAYDPWPVPVLGRAITYGLLWILAVEIPLVVRRLATSWPSARRNAPSAGVVLLVTVLATAVLVFFWAHALPWLITPVLSWTNAGRSQPWVTDPTWLYWQYLVVGATLISGIAAVWPRPVRSGISLAADGSNERPTTARIIARQTLAALALAALLAGIMTSFTAAAILILALLVAGPVLTVVLPRVRIRPFGPPPKSPGRWVIAMVIALAVSWLIVTLIADATPDGYFTELVALAVAAPLFRILLELGAISTGHANTQPRQGPPTAVVTSAIVLLAVTRLP
jgi:hypothetical protein